MGNCFVDLHCDTLLRMWQKDCGLDTASGHISLEKLYGVTKHPFTKTPRNIFVIVVL